MSETLTHTQLVGTLVGWARENIGNPPGLCVYCDSPTVLKTEKPPSIGGYFSDLYAITSPPSFTIVGEAKTIPDIDSGRTFNQILAFLRFLSSCPYPRLVLAMPWQAKATAKNIVRLARIQANAPDVPVVYLCN